MGGKGKRLRQREMAEEKKRQSGLREALGGRTDLGSNRGEMVAINLWACEGCGYRNWASRIRCNACLRGKTANAPIVNELWRKERIPPAIATLSAASARGTYTLAPTGRKPTRFNEATRLVAEDQRQQQQQHQQQRLPRQRQKQAQQQSQLRGPQQQRLQTSPQQQVAAGPKGDQKNEKRDEEEWQQGGPSSSQRKRARRERERRSKEGDEDMGCEASDEGEDKPSRTQPIILPEVPRITLLRRLEARKEELQNALDEGEMESTVRKLKRRIGKLEQEVKISGGFTNRRQTFTIIDIEKNIVKTEAALEKAEKCVEERKQALEDAQSEREEVQQRLDNLRKRLAHVAARKAQEVTEQEDAKALRQAMASIQRLAGGTISDEALLLLKHLQRLLPTEEDEAADDASLSSSTSSSSESNDTVATMEEEEGEDSFNESDYDPEKVADIKEMRNRLSTLQRELKVAISGAAKEEACGGRQEKRNEDKEAESETPALSAVQKAKTYKNRIKDAAVAVDEARKEGRKEIVPQIRVGKDGDKQGSSGPNIAVIKSTSYAMEGRWGTAEEREAKARRNNEMQQKQQDIERAELELRKHTKVLREVIQANAQIKQQDAEQAQQELEAMAMQAALAHSTGKETEEQSRDLQMYWYEVLQTAARSMSAKISPTLRELPRRSGNGDGERKRGVRSQAARTQSPRMASSSSSGMEVLDAEATKRRKDRARRQASRSPRGRRGRALTREL